MENKLNPLEECFLCWKTLKNNTHCAANEEVLSLSKFQFSKQQADNCKKHLKSDILIKCNKPNIKTHRWECENFCSTCFDTSETLTALIEVLEETQRELNVIVDQFNDQILNERCKKLNSSLSAPVDSDTGDLSDGFGGEDFLDNEEEYDVPNKSSTISNANISNGFKESSERASEPKLPEETEELLSIRSKKRKSKTGNQGTSTKKSAKAVPRIVLERMSDGVADIMQEKLIERLIREGIIAEPPPIYKSKNVGSTKRESDLRDENNLFIVKPVHDESSDTINGIVEIKQELCDFDNSGPFQNDEEGEMIDTPKKANAGPVNPNIVPLVGAKDLRIKLSRIKFGARERKKKLPMSPTTTQAIKSHKNSPAATDNAQSERIDPLDSDITQQSSIKKEGLDIDTRDVKLIQYKCETCEFLAASFEELFQHKKTHNPDQPLKCTRCRKEFNKEISFFTHMRYHTVNSSSLLVRPPKKRLDMPIKNKCNHCCKSFTTIYLLNKHQKTKHMKQEAFQFPCKIRGKMFWSDDRGHRWNSTTRPFKCNDCHLRFQTVDRLVFHQRNEQSDGPSKSVLFECEICGDIYSDAYHLKRHHLRNHNGDKPFKCEDCGLRFADSKSFIYHRKDHISTFDFICDRENCGEKFKIVQELNMHKRNHMKQDFLSANDKGKYYECPNCGITFERWCSKEFANHMFSHQLKFVCSICENKFATKILLAEHHATEHGNRYPCKLCSQTFTVKAGVAKHVKAVHMESDLHVCEDCGASFKTKNSFNDHRNQKHPKESEPTIECDKCDRKFFSRNQMMYHKRESHNYQQCEVCGLTVRSMKKHRLTHNTIPFECEICGKQFNRKISLGRHKRAIHEGQQKECKHCGRKFNSANTLRLHLRTHTGEKPFECSACGKRFDRKQNLTTHMRFHTGEKPYKCDKCGKQFSRKDNLNTHVKKC